MTPTQRTILELYAVIVAVWPIRFLVIWFVGRRLDILTPKSPQYSVSPPPHVTAIIPAKDEEGTLADCLTSVCAQTYPNLDILVVDDRSADRTGAIAREFAEKDSRVRLITIEHLPDGWTGKTHALQVASDQARGEWFWFLDADTRFTPENLTIVMEYARERNALMASLLPEMRCESFWEKAVQPLAGIVLMQSYPLFLVNNDRSSLAFANGQYILIERSAYTAVGGHRSVRDRFVEDIGLAEFVKKSGRPIRVAVARGIGSTRMYTSLGQLIRGWSRILYDALGRSPWRLFGRLIDPIIFSQSGHVALLAAVALVALGRWDAFTQWLLGLSVAHYILNAIVFQKVYEWSVPKSRHVAWFPVANLIVEWILVRAIRMCLTGQVTWRGTVYGPSAADTSPVTEPVIPA